MASRNTTPREVREERTIRFPDERAPETVTEPEMTYSTNTESGLNLVDYKRAFAENVRMVQSWLKPSPMMRNLISRFIDIPPWDRTMCDEPQLPTMIRLYVIARHHLETGSRRMSPSDILVAIMAETSVPALPDSFFLERDPARERLVEVVRHLIQDGDLREELVDMPTDTTPLIGPTLTGILRNPQGAITPTQAMQILYFLALRARHHVSGVTILAHMFIGTMKRGSFSDGFIDKIRRSIEQELHVTIPFDAEALLNIQSQYREYMSADVARTISQYWRKLIPPQALRLRITVEQAAGSNMTALTTTGKAIATYADFPWPKVIALYTDEWSFFCQAVKKVNNDPFYGFNADLAPISSAKYRSLAWVGKELMIRIAGQTTLNQYAGWVRRPREQSVIEMILDKYIQERGDFVIGTSNVPPSAGDEPQSLIDLRETIRNCPAVYSD